MKGEEKIMEILKKMHLQIRKWKYDSRNALCWSFYYVNDNKAMNVKCSIDKMHSLLCKSTFNIKCQNTSMIAKIFEK
jgi:hypothetical protein